MKKKIPFHILTVILLIFIDQITKYFAVKNLSGNSGIELIKGVFKLYLLEGGNSGAAFGILQGQFYFFAVITVLIVGAIVFILLKIPFNDKRYIPMRITLLFLISGAIGNFIDRVYSFITTGRSSVVDFLYFHLIEFPIFNVADIYVTLSAIALFVLVIFYYKDSDFGFLKRKGF